MYKYLIEVHVNENDLRIAAQDSAGDEVNNMSVEEMVVQEMNWVGQSGIHLYTIKEITDGEEHIQ